MSKIMLVIDNKMDQDFLEKVLLRLKYTVIAMREGVDLSMQLIDHFPDVVFASTLGRNPKILEALGKIKQARGKPKLVFVKQQGESTRLNATQKMIIDGVLYSPIDPFKLIDLLASTTEKSKKELRRQYNEMLEQDRQQKRGQAEAPQDVSLKITGGATGSESQSDRTKVKAGKSGQAASGDFKHDFGDTKVFGKGADKSKQDLDPSKEDIDFGGVGTAGVSVSGATDLGAKESSSVTGSIKSQGQESVAVDGALPEKSGQSSGSPLINDSSRKSKYDNIVKALDKNNPKPTPLDIEKLRSKQKEQSSKVEENESIKTNRKHFLKTIFSMKPEDVKKESS